jgi:hypothetical protein
MITTRVAPGHPHSSPKLTHGDNVFATGFTTVSEVDAIGSGRNFTTAFWTEVPSGRNSSGSTNTTLNEAPRLNHASAPRRLRVGADDLEGLVDEDVVGPVDADVVDLVVAVAQFYDPVNDAARVGGQCGFCRLVRGRAAGERP